MDFQLTAFEKCKSIINCGSSAPSFARGIVIASFTGNRLHWLSEFEEKLDNKFVKWRAKFVFPSLGVCVLLDWTVSTYDSVFCENLL